MQFEQLMDDLKTGIGLVRVNAVIELGKRKEEKAVPALIATLKDPNMALRSNAAFALGEIGSQTAVPHLIELFHDPEERVRKSAVKALGMIASRDCIAPLIQMLDTDSSRIVKKSVIRSLGQIGDPKALHAVERYVNSLDTTLSDTAKKAVEMLNK